VGAVLTGVFAHAAWGGTASGLLDGNPRQVLVQVMAVAATLAWSAAATWGLLKLISVAIPLRVDSRDEGLGLDVSQHGEEAYGHAEGAILVLPEATTSRLVPAVDPLTEPAS
jgi:ammonium transporter, Amt family